eukprot:CAMPEP_0172558482 /NCGR_PEP_ID=MMETSP1067-20121228/79300_1 /TAXON_ID=265564 ORGANISM="Thalassiosira punctigera, Strain Tpunct2005C2" /NCGR_SAMPLE_ID=MMETSP1067 /ASSEMBLY_ACC=CAM_ASM_000444 /LENGTH=43 /DNA_ID= /DNA_START= /DNA_END= /DNA_ORIENTATION=
MSEAALLPGDAFGCSVFAAAAATFLCRTGRDLFSGDMETRAIL